MHRVSPPGKKYHVQHKFYHEKCSMHLSNYASETHISIQHTNACVQEMQHMCEAQVPRACLREEEDGGRKRHGSIHAS
jgi:hypothetical protein